MPGPTSPEAASNDDVPSKSKRTAAASRFVNDEAEDSSGDDDNNDDDDDIQYNDVVEIPAKANDDAKDDRNDDYDEMSGGDGDVDFGPRDDPIDFDGPRAAADPRTADRPRHQRQSPFSPSSTPLDEPRRIFCWNHEGVVTLRDDDAAGGDGNNLVDIAFHETAGLAAGGRRPVTFTDNLGFIVDTLGEEGGMFATDLAEDDDDDYDGEDEDDFAGLGVMSAIARKAMRRSRKAKRKAGGGGAGGSSVYFYRFETFGRNADKDWVMALPDVDAPGGGRRRRRRRWGVHDN